MARRKNKILDELVESFPVTETETGCAAGVIIGDVIVHCEGEPEPYTQSFQFGHGVYA